MKRFIKYINNNVLIKVASLNSVSLVTRIAGGLLTSNAIAHFIGAEGLALIGNLRNFIYSVQSLATLGLYNGVVKYIAEFTDFKEIKAKIDTIISNTNVIHNGSIFFCNFLVKYFKVSIPL